MAETTKQQTQPSVESVRERGGQSAVGAAEGAAAQVARRATAGATQALHAQGEAVRRGASLGAETAEDAAHATAEAARAAGDAAARTARHTTDAAAEAGEHIAADAAGQVSEIGRRVARAVEDGAEDMRRILLLPRLAGGGMQEAQQVMAALLDGVLRTNLRMARDIAHMADPTSVLDMQRRFMREHLEAMMEGSAHILRAARHTADETLRPLEEHLHDMRERPPMRGADDARGAWSWGTAAQHHRVGEVMRTGVRMVAPDDTVQQAARVMAEEGTATLPVGEDGRLVGVVTGRDLAVRLLAGDRDPARTRVREVMRPEPPCAFEDEDAGHAAETMADEQISRLPVVSRGDRRFLGVVALADLAASRAGKDTAAGRAERR